MKFKLRKKKFGILLVGLFFLLPMLSAQSQLSFSAKIEGRGQAIILIPGLTCDAAVWDGTKTFLKGKYQTHTLSIAGFANNPPFKKSSGKYLDIITKNVIDYIKANKLDFPILIGHSFGGFIALNVAIQEPEIVSKLVVIDALPFLPAIRNPAISKEEALVYAKNYKANMIEKANQPEDEKAADQRSFLQFMISDSSKIEWAIEWYMKSDLKTISEIAYELNTTDIRTELSKIKASTLVLGSWIAGKPYGATREGALKGYQNQYQKLSNITIDMSDKGKHFIMWDDPEFLYRWLKKFFPIKP